MTIQYSILACIYPEIYQHIFDYDLEFKFFHELEQLKDLTLIAEKKAGEEGLAN